MNCSGCISSVKRHSIGIMWNTSMIDVRMGWKAARTKITIWFLLYATRIGTNRVRDCGDLMPPTQSLLTKGIRKRTIYYRVVTKRTNFASNKLKIYLFQVSFLSQVFIDIGKVFELCLHLDFENLYIIVKYSPKALFLSKVSVKIEKGFQ